MCRKRRRDFRRVVRQPTSEVVVRSQLPDSLLPLEPGIGDDCVLPRLEVDTLKCERSSYCGATRRQDVDGPSFQTGSNLIREDHEIKLDEGFTEVIDPNHKLHVQILAKAL